MTKIDLLKNATSLHDVAHLLGFKPSALSYVLYIKPHKSKYTNFEIPKKSGGTRTISAPYPELKLLQKRLATLLELCIIEINSSLKIKSSLSHGFVPKHSIITNAKVHRNKTHVFNIDLSDFFGTVNFGRVRGYFITNKDFALNPTVATLLAQIACHDNALPQGSPSSPVISNLIGHILDIKLARFAGKHGCLYSRYADDITFSTNKQLFPKQIAHCVDIDKHIWEAGGKLTSIISHAGFFINASKTRMQFKTFRQEVTGLVVNIQVNTKSEYRHLARAMVDRLWKKGTYQLKEEIKDENGLVLTPAIDGTLEKLGGILSFIDSICVYNLKKNLPEKFKTKDLVVQEFPSAVEKTYRKFLYFKHFYASPKPVIVFEGITDDIYFKCALRYLAAGYPTLAQVTASTYAKKIRFLHRSPIVKRILGLTGGTGEFPNFIKTYLSEIKGAIKIPLQSPVIIFVDNDEGSKGLYSYLKKDKITVSKDPFIYIGGNLYLVVTPLTSAGEDTMIESFFPPSLLTTIWNGKSFHPQEKGYDGKVHYAKKIFAKEIVEANADKIDFSGFKPLLDRINAAIEDFEKIKFSL